jgi:general secretion pathway protein E
VLIVGPNKSGRRSALYSMLQEAEALRPTGQQTQSRRLQAAMPIEKISAPAFAQAAIQAAQAGHLVVSTMAVGRACSAVAELRRLHATTQQILDALSLVIAQRLIARLCNDCSRPDDRALARQALAAALNTWWYGHTVQLRRSAPGGCARCGHTGYAGQVLVYELLDIDERARGLIASNIDPVELERALVPEGCSLWDCGLRRVGDGVTSFDALLAGVRQPH